MLRWLYDQRQHGTDRLRVFDVMATSYTRFEGEPLSDGEIISAVRYLADKRLIEIVKFDHDGRPTSVALTHRGDDCVADTTYGGDVTKYVRDHSDGPSKTVNKVGTVKVRQGIASVAGMVGSQQVNEGINQDVMVGLVEALLKGLPDLPMAEDGAALRSQIRQELEQALQEMETQKPDRTSVPAAFERAVAYLADAGKPVLTAAFLLVARHYGVTG